MFPNHITHGNVNRNVVFMFLPTVYTTRTVKTVQIRISHTMYKLDVHMALDICIYLESTFEKSYGMNLKCRNISFHSEVKM